MSEEQKDEVAAAIQEAMEKTEPPEDLKDLLKGKPDPVESDLQFEAADADESVELPTPPKPGDPADPVATDETFERPSSIDQVFQWYLDEGDEKVEVTEAEKDIYWQDAVLSGERFRWDIPIGPSRVKVRSMTVYEYDVIAYAMFKVSRARENMALGEMIGYTQGLSVLMSVERIDVVGITPFECSGNIEEDADRLLKEYQDKWATSNVARAQVCQRAMQLFARKLHVCKTNLSNLGFWLPADTD